MKRGEKMKIHNFIIILVALGFLFGCGKEAPSRKPVEKTSFTGDAAAIEASLKELFDRTKEGDKTVLYENEFSYYKLDYSISQYMELDMVRKYKYDTLKGIEVDSVDLMGDSARVKVRVIYQSENGGEKEVPYKTTMYRSQGQWIKPYMSRWDGEKDYLEQKRIYDSVTAGQ
jgi:hypothetical protein